MGAYDSKKFSKIFAERTEENYNFISNIVNRSAEEEKIQNEFLKKYDDVLKDMDTLIKEISDEAKEVNRVQKQGKNPLKKKLYSISTRIEGSQNYLKNEMRKIVSSKEINEKNLYEVTQLLNSLMGIAVLPYEMHREYFDKIDEELCSEKNKDKITKELQNSLKDACEYKALKDLIFQFHQKGKWTSTYRYDIDKKGEVNVFSFLRHMRNATCHSGANAIGIIPLDEGKIINGIMFYDKHKDDSKQEFAMYLEIDELEKLIFYISDFYKNSDIGNNDKSKNIRRAEERVKELLKTEIE